MCLHRITTAGRFDVVYVGFTCRDALSISNPILTTDCGVMMRGTARRPRRVTIENYTYRQSRPSMVSLRPILHPWRKGPDKLIVTGDGHRIFKTTRVCGVAPLPFYSTSSPLLFLCLFTAPGVYTSAARLDGIETGF